MDRWYTIRLVGCAAGAWSFALAAAIFQARHPVVIITANIATVASVWVIARMSVDKIHDHIVTYTSKPVRKFDR